MALEVVGHQAKLVHDLTRPVGMRQKLMDSSIARDNFDWNPSTSLRDGMTMTYEDFLSGSI
jgi:GDP-L-fucose synthase